MGQIARHESLALAAKEIVQELKEASAIQDEMFRSKLRAMQQEIAVLKSQANLNLAFLVVPFCGSILFELLRRFAKLHILPVITQCADSTCLISSPYAGNVEIQHARQVAASSRQDCGLSMPSLKVATLNPGRLGLASLANQVLKWRLWDIAGILLDPDT